MPCCSFHMLLSHRQPHSGALLQLCSGFVLLKGRYCCLLRVQHLYVGLSGVYPDDVQDTDKFHFPSMFSRVYWTSKLAPISCSDWRLFPLSFPVWEQGDWCTGHWALPGACCPQHFPPWPRDKAETRPLVSLDLQIQHLAVVASQDFSLGKSVFAPGTISFVCPVGGQPPVSLPLQGGTSVFPWNKQPIIHALHEALKSYRSVGKPR